jgi:DnaJ like chaperone protein
MQYRQHKQPGCGGCLLIICVLVLVIGGAPALLGFIGYIAFAAFAGFALLFVGAYCFSFYIRRKISVYEASRTEIHKRFVHLLVHILVKIAELDGRFSRAELATMTNFFQHSLNYNQDQMYWVKQLIKDARDAETTSMDELLSEFRDSFAAYESRLILLELIYQIIYIKRPVDQRELAQARQIATFLSVHDYDLRNIEAKYMYGQQENAASVVHLEKKYYAVLGLEEGAEFNVIKKAYRKLSMQYHPDKVAHLGDEFKGVAEEKMKEINEAYGFFKKKFNTV